MSPFDTRTPAHAITKKINFPVRRPSSGPSLARVRQIPSFKLFAIPKEADNTEVMKVKINKAGVLPMIVLDIEVSILAANHNFDMLSIMILYIFTLT